MVWIPRHNHDFHISATRGVDRDLYLFSIDKIIEGEISGLL